MSSQTKFSEHPDYQENAFSWQLHEDLYIGDHRTLVSNPDYLWPHELETRKGGEELRAIRQRRTRYLNLHESIVSRWDSFLFRGEVVLTEAQIDAIGEDVYDDITGTGVSFQSFVKNFLALHYILFGRPRVLIDSPLVAAQTVGQAKQAGLRPYAEMLSPLEVKDFQISDEPGRKGKYDFIRCEYEVIEPRLTAADIIKCEKYSRVYAADGTKYTITTYKGDKDATGQISWKQLDEYTVPRLTEIPVSTIEGEDSLIKDVSQQCLTLFNLMSAEASILNASAFQKIFVIGVSSDSAKLAFGEYAVNFLPEGASVDTVEPTSTAAIKDAINDTIDRIFKIAFNQVHRLAADSKESPGVESQREAKDDFVALITSLIEELEQCINDMLKNIALFRGKKFPGEVQLDKNITNADIEQELSIWAAHKDDFKQIPTAYKQIIRKRLADLNLGEEEKIDAEIEAANFSATPDKEDLNGQTKQNLLTQVTGVGREEPKAAA